ncbi:malate dehydrogenase (oxaloacetate-decarboxylating) [Kineosphaera limosa]|uniref:Putative malate dehydrogenase n=1 Tax=Kineosphaera limosa NBRC 100340 TaxID=1184609 RepID=K6WVT5_9MICO|nr:putative malate dehydrogenase [Kineosphaera limosa]NYE03270.1 malate dehydrogenase (oxaloacetate-decarboxylating) [Kineosphaera limosa]GAB96207.1 putative malate dehydrogenase [Kineosphaera limosa NBRC 100340]
MSEKPSAITNPLTNRGTAFTREERARLGLTGRLPAAVETLDQQAARAHHQLQGFDRDIDKYVFLDQLHSRNEVLYYKVLTDHLTELLPIVYDPTVGEAIKEVVAGLPPVARRLPVDRPPRRHPRVLRDPAPRAR